jgi:hypothetical protein
MTTVNSLLSLESPAAVDDPSIAMSATPTAPGPAVPLSATAIADAAASDGTSGPASGETINPLWIVVIGHAFFFAAMAALLTTGYR